jgi:hypothetical protein
MKEIDDNTGGYGMKEIDDNIRLLMEAATDEADKAFLVLVSHGLKDLALIAASLKHIAEQLEERP